MPTRGVRQWEWPEPCRLTVAASGGGSRTGGMMWHTHTPAMLGPWRSNTTTTATTTTTTHSPARAWRQEESVGEWGGRDRPAARLCHGRGTTERRPRPRYGHPPPPHLVICGVFFFLFLVEPQQQQQRPEIMSMLCGQTGWRRGGGYFWKGAWEREGVLVVGGGGGGTDSLGLGTDCGIYSPPILGFWPLLICHLSISTPIFAILVNCCPKWEPVI